MSQSGTKAFWFALILSVAVGAAPCRADHLLLEPVTSIWRAPVADDPWGEIAGLGKFQTLMRPVSVAAREHLVFIADAGMGVIYRYNRDTEVLAVMHEPSAMTGGDVAGMFVDYDGSFYVADRFERRVLHFTVNGEFIHSYSDDLNLAEPRAVALLMPQRNVVVADGLYDHLLIFNAMGWPVQALGQRGEGPGEFREIIDMAAGPQGLYVVDRFNSTVQIMDGEGGFHSAMGRAEVTMPVAIAADRDGRVFIADQFDDTIKVYHGNLYLGSFGGSGNQEGQFRNITDLAVDGQFLFVADSANARVQVLFIKPWNDKALERQGEGL